MKRKPCTKVPLPVSPKRRVRSCSSSPTNVKNVKQHTRGNAKSEEDSDSLQELVNLKAKSPFYKRVLGESEGCRSKACAKEIIYTDRDEHSSGKPEKAMAEEVEAAEPDRSGVSLNSSYITLSTADTSSLSQGSTGTCSSGVLSNSQSSRDGFTLSKLSSDSSEQLDYNDTLTSGERTPNRSFLSPRNTTLAKPGNANSSLSSKSNSSSPAVEVVIERDIVEFIDYDKFDDDTHKHSSSLEPMKSDSSRLEAKEMCSPKLRDTIPDKFSMKNTASSMKNTTSSQILLKDKIETEMNGRRLDKVDETVDENNNVDGSLNQNQHTSDQEVMSKTYKNQNATRKMVVSDDGKQVVGAQHTSLSPSEPRKDSQRVCSATSGNGMSVQNNVQKQGPVQLGFKEAALTTPACFSAVMPHDIEPRQLMQIRQDSSCPLSPITEENAVERVAKELVNTYGGQNSHRIPEILHDSGRLSDYDYNSSFGPSLPYQQSRDARQHYPQQQASQNADYTSNRHDILRESHSLQSHMTNGSFGEPQGSSTPEVYQRRPISFSPDDFPSPYNYDVLPPSQNWLGNNIYGNSYQQNSKQPDYFLQENPLGGPSFSSSTQQKCGYRGKGIIDLPGGGDYRPVPQAHDNTTMTFTPRSLMESHLSSSYCTGSSQSSSGPKQSCPPLDTASHRNPPLRNMDCSSIYPSREFIEKNSGSYRPATPAKVPSYETLVPPLKKRKLKSLSETDIEAEKDLDGYHLGLPPLEAHYGPPRHKYYVVNPSDALSMAPKTLISKYIDFLVLENEQITEISKSVSQPVDIYVTEDMYFMDTLKNRVPFPSKKFMEWVRSFYPKLRLGNMRFHGMNGKQQDLPRGEDRRPTQQVLEDIFYYFQRQVMNLED